MTFLNFPVLHLQWAYSSYCADNLPEHLPYRDLHCYFLPQTSLT